MFVTSNWGWFDVEMLRSDWEFLGPVADGTVDETVSYVKGHAEVTNPRWSHYMEVALRSYP